MDKMDECVVCLTPISNILSGISSKSSEWQEHSVQRIIKKHLWWWSLKQSTTIQWVCRICWRELSTFHTFFNRVENAHRQYDLLNARKVDALNKEEAINARSLVPKEEFQIVDNLSFSTHNWKQEENAVAAQGDKIKNLKTEPLKVQDYDDNLYVNTSDDNWQKNTNNGCEEIESKGNIDLFVIKEEFNITERSLTANSEEVKHLVAPKTKRKKKSLEHIKEPEASSQTNNVTQCTEASEIHNTIAKVEVNQTKKRIKKHLRSQLKVEISRANCEYLDKSSFKFFCHLCQMPLSDFRNLKTHYRLEHNIVGYAVCCNKKFYNRATLADHLRVHENPNYFKCQSCSKILSNRISFETHMAYHKLPTGGLNPVYNCNKCDTLFLNKAAYTRHSFLHVPVEERKFQCDECNKKFGAEHLLKLHKTFAHLKKYCKICEICGKSFRERFSFKRHMDEHNGKPSKKIPCDLCGVELTNKYLFNRHKKLMHTEENLQEQICPHCSKVSPNMAAHRQHVFYNHTLERKHACHICDKKFKLALKLREHLSTHTGEPLFTCSFCSQTFISKTRMYKHRKDAHPIEWQEVKPKKADPNLNRLSTTGNLDINFSEINDVKRDLNNS